MSESGRLLSLDEMMAAAREHMLSGTEPASQEDWVKVVNFMAANIASGLEVQACRLLTHIYDMPLTMDEVTLIAEYQAAQKGKRND